MKRKVGLLALFLAALMCILTVSALATGESAKPIPFDDDAQEFFYEGPEIQDDEIEKYFEEIFGTSSDALMVVFVLAIASSMLFMPALIIAIVFGVLNSRTKKSIREYERFFGPIPQNPLQNYYNPNAYAQRTYSQGAYNQGTYSQNTYNQGAYQSPVNPQMNTNAPVNPASTAPTGTNTYNSPYNQPQNNINNGQGGQF